MNRYAICCCAKYEDDYIIEWITYHLNLGFDYIYINDNNDDSKILPSILEQKLPKELLNKIDINHVPGRVYQMQRYEDFYCNQDFKWVALIDCDEFITLNGFTNIKDYINSFPEDCNTIVLHWLKYYTEDVYYNEKPITERNKFVSTPIISEIQGYSKEILKKGFEYNFKNFPITTCLHRYNLGSVYFNNFIKLENNKCDYVRGFNFDVAYIRHYYVRDIMFYLNYKIYADVRGPSKEIQTKRFLWLKRCQNYSLTPMLIPYANVNNPEIEKYKNKKILVKNENKLLPFLKQDLNIVYCGNLKNNLVYIEIANYNKCFYKWVLPEYFNNVYKEEEFDVVIN